MKSWTHREIKYLLENYYDVPNHCRPEFLKSGRIIKVEKIRGSRAE